jgi:hypothetical protein
MEKPTQTLPSRGRLIFLLQPSGPEPKDDEESKSQGIGTCCPGLLQAILENTFNSSTTGKESDR